MKWGRYLPESLAVLVVVALEGIDWAHSTLLSDPVPKPTPWNAERKLAARFVFTKLPANNAHTQSFSVNGHEICGIMDSIVICVMVCTNISSPYD